MWSSKIWVVSAPYSLCAGCYSADECLEIYFFSMLISEARVPLLKSSCLLFLSYFLFKPLVRILHGVSSIRCDSKSELDDIIEPFLCWNL
jgi:hypothetical protein